MAIPTPSDPRTPKQRIQEQLAAAHKKLVGPALSRQWRVELADRIYQLKQQDRQLD